MTLLLDTHVLLWWLSDDRALTRSARQAIADPAATVYVSAASAWEISIKTALGKLSAPNDLEDQIKNTDLTELPVTVVDAVAAGALPRHHDDPFDRMLVAQAQRRGLTILTRDRSISRYGVATLGA
jgi:PIN domain nuclease of toxin-antitoxin system